MGLFSEDVYGICGKLPQRNAAFFGMRWEVRAYNGTSRKGGGCILDTKKSILALLMLSAAACTAAAVCGTPRGEAWLGSAAERWQSFAGTVERVLPKTAEQNEQKESAYFAEGLAPESSLPPFTAPSPTPETGAGVSDENATPKIVPTTIQGGMVLTNETSYELDLGALVNAGTSVRLGKAEPQVLIVHTHGSEAYSKDPAFPDYKPTDSFRSADAQYSVIRIGDELEKCLEADGISVVHDREIYDAPSYTGSYARSGDAVAKYLKKYPSISVVFDVHRDAIGSNDVVYKTLAEAGGTPCSQVMLVVGTNASGLYHPDWQENLKFALYLQQKTLERHPTLLRPIALKKGRYNQQLKNGSILIEVGSSGNTLSEALTAVRLFAEVAGPALQELQSG